MTTEAAESTRLTKADLALAGADLKKVIREEFAGLRRTLIVMMVGSMSGLTLVLLAIYYLLR